MASYAKKTCFGCGIKLPQPEMREELITPVGVNGNNLSPRLKWMCPTCDAPYEFTRFKQRELEKAQDAYEKLQRDRFAEGKQNWREEQERRRLANLNKKDAP